MPITRMKYAQFDGGLYITGPSEQSPPNTLRKAVGLRGRLEKHIVSRYGSKTHPGALAHSLFNFQSNWYCGTETGTLVRGTSAVATTIHTGLTGKKLTFVRMPPSPEVASQNDYLFVAGGGMGTLLGQSGGALPGNLFKVKSDGTTIQRWGIAIPVNGFLAAAGASGNLNGTYTYRVTFLNNTTGTRSNPNTADVTVTVINQRVQLSNLPESDDPQVDRLEIWRTVGNQAIPFLVAAITDGTSTYEDNISDIALTPTELPLDNIDPALASSFAFQEAAGPHAGRMWWTRNTKTGSSGRVYFSPSGRSEAVAGFVEVTSTDAPVQRIIPWNVSIYAFTKEGIYEIFGVDEPFIYRQIYGAPGTVYPWTVVPTAYGIVYRDNQNAFRLFNGVQATIIGMAALTGVLIPGANPAMDFSLARYAAFGRDEYLVSDGATHWLGLTLIEGKVNWREIGNVAPTVIAASDAGDIAYSFGVEA